MYLHTGHKALAQQEPLFSQYMFNTLVINPAYAGSQESMCITASARKQWIGMNGAPSTQTLSAHSPIKNERIGLGLILINDMIGVTHQYSANAIYSYKILFDKNRRLSFGLQAGFYQFSTNLSSLATKDANDNSFYSDIKSRIIPSFGTGIYYSSSQSYIGFSVPYLVNNILRDNSTALGLLQKRHYLITGGIVIGISPSLKIKPSMLIKGTQGVPLQFDVNANFIIKEVLWLGLSYRSKTSYNFLVQVQLNDQLRVGYSYDLPLNQLKGLVKGSHEIVVTYNFLFRKNKLITPRYF